VVRFCIRFFVVIPEGNLRFAPACFFVVIPEGNLRFVFAFAFLLSFPKGICGSHRPASGYTHNPNP